ncbi:ECF transporter S component [Thermogladius sp. 4427co]|uniref:ECF transporter S component n=1 Tax=Thermogladius sp. 4427co TaxID=3450718 RepID=UPI003F797D0D
MRRALEAVVFTVLVYVSTIALQIYQPVTGGYFNLGESMIYLAALVSTPLVAAIAGGVGASLADLSTGYAIFAPATFIIKFVEGYVAGVLVALFRRTKHKSIAAASVGAVYAAGLYYGALYWAGTIEFGPSKWLTLAFTPSVLTIPLYAWILLIVLLGALVAYGVFRFIVRSFEPIGLLLAGFIMVTGYFLYEYFVSNPLTGRPPANAIYEIPVNIGQAIAGVVISLPIAVWLYRAGFIREEAK